MFAINNMEFLRIITFYRSSSFIKIPKRYSGNEGMVKFDLSIQNLNLKGFS